MTEIKVFDEDGREYEALEVVVKLRALDPGPVSPPVDPVPDPEPDPVPDPETPPEEPEPEDPTEPEPEEPPVINPPAPPPSLEGRPPSIIRYNNPARTLNWTHYWNGTQARYERFQRLIVWRGNSVTASFKVQDLSGTGGGKVMPFSASKYPVTLDGKVVAEAHVEAGVQKHATVSFSIADLKDGEHILDVISPAGETSVPFSVFRLREGNAVPEQKWMSSMTLSYGINRQQFVRLEWVPAAFAPNPVPRKRAIYTHFSNTPSASNLWAERILPTSGYNRRTNRSADGILNTNTSMWYNWSGVVEKIPRYPLLDGPRGVGTIGSPTHIHIGEGRQSATDPDSPLMGNLYVSDPWRVCRVSPSGHITTLVGYRHKSIPTYWEDDPLPDLELVGDWSAIPEDERGIHETWGFAWQQASLDVDTDADPIPGEDNRQPHLTAPVMFIADSQNNRVLRVEFNARAHGIPPKVTVFIRANDPWDCVTAPGSLFVSERKSHRICEYDDVTGELKRIVVQGRPLAELDRHHRVIRLAPIDVIQAEDVVAPEGLYIMDEWLYYASVAMRQVKRVHIATGEIEVAVQNVTKVGSQEFLKIAVSNGTFAPRGTVFVCDWSVTYRGFPSAWLSNGKRWNFIGNPSVSNLPNGPASNIASIGYSHCVAVKGGRMVCGSVQEGLVEFRLKLPTDPEIDRALYTQGAEKWGREDLSLLYGDGGYGYYGLPLPWGYSPETDYYLEVEGHTRPA